MAENCGFVVSTVATQARSDRLRASPDGVWLCGRYVPLAKLNAAVARP